MTAKAAAGATKAALPGISFVAVRNLMLRTIRHAQPWRATLKVLLSALLCCDRFAVHSAVPAVFELRDYAQPLTRIHLIKTLVTFCQKTGRRLRLYINRQVAKLCHKGQLKISVAVSLPPIAKVEVSYQCDFNAKSDNDNKPKGGLPRPAWQGDFPP
ncbi:hypothetical protein CN085_27735 [Sinorhizobium meliloti]|uniref:hypothetical protein n=1 Tax=Rhizobium meliloti TaxID=382 RepID=UPI000B49B8DF|nr:hypothetical protein [Sinorhizobium meliloti]ASP76422.1 hypothetical protein CDO28_34085 [Sinorhizobium meliloti]MDE3857027.1 hypothetical protein [Sinorhizobium meliloti]RVP09934.1 hypothetical protein CN085_27735 [Sinorhizobium meliloti]